VARIDVKTYILAALLTILLFSLIYIVNSHLSNMREDTVTVKMNEIIEDFEEIESFYYLQEYIKSQNNSCDALINNLHEMESKIWKLDERIRNYRLVTQQIENDAFYIQEKSRLNRRQLIYMTQLNEVKKNCGDGQSIILYFYGDCYGNRRCDEQGFVLTYLNQKIDSEVAILSFDADRATPSIKSLMDFHNVTALPCVVIEGNTHCGLHDKVDMESLLCRYSPHLSICK
jgi:hypothetical protein